MSEPIDIDGRTRTLSLRERLTSCLSGAATTEDLELRLAFVGAARSKLAAMDAELAGLKIAVVAAEDEARRLVKISRGGHK